MTGQELVQDLMNAQADRFARTQGAVGPLSVGSQRLFDWLNERL
jgi:hypothetical protein